MTQESSPATPKPDQSADYGRLMPWLILAFTLGWLAFFGVLKLIVWAAT